MSRQHRTTTPQPSSTRRSRHRSERAYPMRVLRYRLRRGSGGGGQAPGGEGIERVIQVLEPATVSLITERRANRPWGALRVPRCERHPRGRLPIRLVGEVGGEGTAAGHLPGQRRLVHAHRLGNQFLAWLVVAWDGAGHALAVWHGTQGPHPDRVRNVDRLAAGSVVESDPG